LQVLDDGRLTDNQGHTVDFSNTILVMTSNIGSQLIREITREGGSEEDIRDAIDDVLTARFLPEFLNRIDETILFHPLKKEEIRKIVTLQIKHLARQLGQHGVGLDVTEAALDAIAEKGYDPMFGARPLKRVVQQCVQNPLAVELLKQELPEGCVVRVDSDADNFTFECLESSD